MPTENWMVILRDTWALHQVTMPGSHDAGVWEGGTTTVGLIGSLLNKSLSVCQSLDLGGQCRAGSRFFDVRVTKFGHDLRALHLTGGQGGAGQGLKSMLNQVTHFVHDYPTEFVIMRFTKCTDHKEILDEVLTTCGGGTTLGNKLYKTPGWLSQATVGALRGQIVAVFDSGFDAAMANWLGPAQGFHHFGKFEDGLEQPGLITCGEYSNSPDFVTVFNKQLERVTDHDTHSDFRHIFVLYWTQTGGNIEEHTTGQFGTHQHMQSIHNTYALRRNTAQGPVKLPTVILYDFVNRDTSSQIILLNTPRYRSW